MTLSEGSLLGSRYELRVLLARGGMGEVWRAVDTRLGREVAVKVLHSAYAGDSDFHERFRAEARNTAAFSHPGVAQVYDFGEADGTPYLVMELVAGEPLSTVLDRQGAIGVPRTLDVLAQTARALEAAHAVGVVHRDVKPGNLLVTPDGTVKVTDFGIARAADALPLTATGTVMGSAPYLSPEQAHGRAATAASDVYALGVVAYECLAGHRPFVGETAVDVAAAHAQDAPPPLPPAIPTPLKELVLAMLGKDPAARPDDRAVAERAEALRGAGAAGAVGTLTSAQTAALPPLRPDPTPTRAQQLAPPVGAQSALRPFTPEPRRRRGALVALVTAAVVIVAGGAYGLSLALTGGSGDGGSADPGTGSAPAAPVATATSGSPAASEAPAPSAEASTPAAEPTPTPTRASTPTPTPTPRTTPTPTPSDTASATPTPTPTPTSSASPSSAAFDPDALVGGPETEAYAAISAAGFSFARLHRALDDSHTACTVADVQPDGDNSYDVTVWWPKDGATACAPLSKGGAAPQSVAVGGDNAGGGHAGGHGAGRHDGRGNGGSGKGDT
ncbi:serine/threonine-protein kinase [Motilibacter peucedani]|uniref:non-specific serine/threonine protein kinase n=1 Tax=Motilibacter peucedani TaxID=598650 RepID=A0A420XUL0_9ACTN|nr:protein kinase [Motilibacter peucedani]RKS80339.1 serine/threonine-protein kinase [Motilibacter peucedani]